jgi:HK97 family phage major capsid protein
MDSINTRAAAIEQTDTTTWFRASTNDIDRHGTIVEPRGIDTANYSANPVFMWGHDAYGSGGGPPDLENVLGRVIDYRKDDSAFDIEGWLAGRIANKFARAEAAAFVNGDGVDKPKGFLTHAAVDNDIWTWGNLGYVPTEVDGDLTPDAIIELVYALGAQYRANGAFVMNSKTAGRVRKLTDADGRFLWSDGLAAGEPAMLMGYPVLVAEDMPDVASGSFSIAFGDFRAGYTVAERPDLRILRDPFSAKPHVLFYATKRVGGDVSDFAAIKLLKFGVA